MAKTITQKIFFKNTTAKTLYDLYTDAKQHAMVTGGPAVIVAKEGSKYSTHGGYISGKNLQLVKDRLIVQTWRTQGWDETDIDSTFILYLEQKGKNVVLQAVHANLPDKHYKSVEKGWQEHYWNLWKQHLAGEPLVFPKM